jgi:hypothetical protein
MYTRACHASALTRHFLGLPHIAHCVMGLSLPIAARRCYAQLASCTDATWWGFRLPPQPATSCMHHRARVAAWPPLALLA